MIRKKVLVRAKPENLIRLAVWLELEIDGLSHTEIAELIYFQTLYI